LLIFPAESVISEIEDIIKTTAKNKPELEQEIKKIHEKFRLLLSRFQILSDEKNKLSAINKAGIVYSLDDPKPSSNIKMGEIIDGVILILSEKLYNIDIKTNYNNLPSITCYPNQLSHVFNNLLSNAATTIGKNIENLESEKASEYTGSITISGEEEQKSNRNGVTIKISDNGEGFPSGMRSRVMGAFFNPGESEMRTGLGLVITLEIIKKHGGWMTFYNKKDKNGAVVEIWVPQEQEQE
jgi:nitrogen fixation/metabolism regulation signal transduction histidine kinase